MGETLLEDWEHFVGPAPCHLHIKRVWAKIETVRPFDGPIGRDGYLLKYAGPLPCGEHAATDQGRQIDDTNGAVVELEFDTESGKRFGVDYFPTSIVARCDVEVEFHCIGRRRFR